MTDFEVDDEVVTVAGLRKSYGDRVVVDGLDLAVRTGEIVGLIGANGAGKTTTVECIQGLRRPDAGTLRVFGMDPMTQGVRVRRLLGSQLQDASLPDRLRVAEAVDLFDEARFGDGADLLEEFGLAARRRSPFAALSGGERQRLFLVLALLNRPRLVILDELTQGLDPAGRRDVWAAVQRLRRSGRSVLLVTHELQEAQVLCDRVIVMGAGRVLDVGTPTELVARHGGHITIRFSLPDSNPAPSSLDQVQGVHEVIVDRATITINGDRECIVHVGAALAAQGLFPADLTVDSPDLEQAVLRMLVDAEPVAGDLVVTTC
ncbi:MAG: hypothetical protein JWM89_1250 [Acidimicrobiales bacterium]|nr:hypothetical protein [Acidimicrobiales bacterium]